jgi:phage terminase small subunit
MPTGLTTKQRVFVERYLANGFNGAEAARYAKYAHPQVDGSRLLGNVSIQAIIQTRLDEEAMSANEVLHRLAAHARGTADDFLTIERVKRRRLPEKEGEAGEEYEALDIGLDLERAKKHGKLHLIKSMKEGQWGLSVELYDAQAALALLGKHHGLFVEQLKLSGDVGIKTYQNVSPDAWDTDNTTAKED